MSKRKDQLKSFFGMENSAPAPSPVQPVGAPMTSAREPVQPKRSSAGAVKAMGLSLGSLSDEVEQARKLREALSHAEQVVEIDTARIEPSPFADRLAGSSDGEDAFEQLKASLQERGQQVPVLLRPHSDEDKAARGLFQIAYGHRRVAAARALGIPVKALVRALSNDELIIAQGKENAERLELSFIERALFAQALIENGFDRSTAQASLSVDKTEMSRLLQVAQGIPLAIARAIGPAPKIGRPRWLALADLLAGGDSRAIAEQMLGQEHFRNVDSDKRFALLLQRLSARESNENIVEQLLGDGDVVIGEISRKGKKTILSLEPVAGEGFADYVAQRLPELHRAFQASQTTPQGS